MQIYITASTTHKIVNIELVSVCSNSNHRRSAFTARPVQSFVNEIQATGERQNKPVIRCTHIV